MAELPYLPLYVDDLHMDTRHLSNEQFGLYVKLLMAAWRDHDNSLPDDPAMICRWIGQTGHRKGKVMALIEEFFHLEDGRWRQKRLDKTRRKVSRNYRQKVAASRKALEAKRLKRNKPGHETGQQAGEPTKTKPSIKKGGGPSGPGNSFIDLGQGETVGASTVEAVKNGRSWVQSTLSAHKGRLMVSAGLVTREELSAVGVDV